MKGDRLVIKDEHRRAAEEVMELLQPNIESHCGKYVVTIAGESGSGKSEIAYMLAEKLTEEGLRCVIIQQDDYFVHPPITNVKVRTADIGKVGTSEVRLELIDQNLADILAGKGEIKKPLAIFEEDRFTTEKLNVAEVPVAIVEGTYTTLLQNVQAHVFIDRTYHDTSAARLERAREDQDEFLERVLGIEHMIIARQKAKADIIIRCDYSVVRNEAAGES